MPKFHFDPATGELGERNGVFATNVEHKMGLKVSNTCELTFGEHGVPAKGWLMGDVHDGIRQMFLDHRVRPDDGRHEGDRAPCRPGTSTRWSTPRTGCRAPTCYSQADKTAPRVTITHHPDVRRSLALQKSYAEGLRALVCYTAGWQDKVQLAEFAGDEAAAEQAGRVNDLLLPLVKGCGSERAYELLGHESLQTFGGSGYLQDYPLEQYVRDAKIDTLYEGTTAIQSLDLVFRKIVKDSGKALVHVAGEIQAFLDARGRQRPAQGGAARAWPPRSPTCRACSRTVTGWLGGGARRRADELYKVGLSSRRILLALGDLIVGWLLQRQAEVALAALGRGRRRDADRAFYEGKVAVGPVLRPRGAAAPGQRPPHRREHHAGRHGPGRGVLLGTRRTTPDRPRTTPDRRPRPRVRRDRCAT